VAEMIAFRRNADVASMEKRHAQNSPEKASTELTS
jgi:hypothetical protein